jgi:hypothetical protein
MGRGLEEGAFGPGPESGAGAVGEGSQTEQARLMFLAVTLEKFGFAWPRRETSSQAA